jgi:hypothetical protein
VQKSFTVLGRLRDLEAHLGNHLIHGETAAFGTVHGSVLRPGPLAENLGDGVAFFATELEERHRSFQNLRAKRRGHAVGVVRVSDIYLLCLFGINKKYNK